MKSALVTWLFLTGIAIGLLLIIFVLPRRKLADEAGKTVIYKEKCFTYWKLHAGFFAASSFPVTRLTFYDNFFIVALVMITKINYTQIKSYKQKNGLFTASLKLDLSDGRTLVIYPKNIEKIKSIISEHVAQ